jgi:ligand-binding sensor domain-containing protein/signal transduction histidine kinase
MNAKRLLRGTTVCTLLAFIVAACQGRALHASQIDSSYLRKTFTIEDGLPDNNVNTIVQSQNGYLWVGTDGGLARFDGQHFTLVRFRGDNSREVPVNTLLAASNGDLWVGTDSGLEHVPKAAVDHFDRTLVSLYHPGVGLSDQIMCLHLSREGVLWVGTNRGLYQLDHSNFVTIIPNEIISRIEDASNGHLLIITSEGFTEWDGSRILRHPEVAHYLGVMKNGIFHVFEDHAGVTWFCTAAGVARRVNDSLQRLNPYGVSLKNTSYRVYEDAKFNLWITRQRGVYRVAGGHLEPFDPTLLAREIYSDRDGDLWIGTGDTGLTRFRKRSIRMYTEADGLPNDKVETVLSGHDGTLWVGNNCGGLSKFDGQRFTTYSEKDGLSNSCVRALAEDRHHDIWVGTWGGGLYRFSQKHFTQYSKPQGFPSDVVVSIVAAQDGSLWIATEAGLVHMQNGYLRNYTLADGLSSDRITTVYEDQKGGIWAGTSAGIDRLATDRFVPVPAPTDVSYVPYNSLHEDAVGNLYGLSLTGGISRIVNNSIFNIRQIQELSGMVEDPQHNLWFSGRQGISRVSAGSFERAATDSDSPADYTSFSRDDGLNSRECSYGQPNIAMTPDGKLWAATLMGLAMLDLNRLPQLGNKSPIYVEEVEVGRSRRTPTSTLVLSPGAYHVAFRFTAIELSSPENIRLQYRLDGVDPAWLDADSTRAATYTSIPVGTHAFHVRASSGAGVWDRAGIVYSVTQLPFFYETIWFRLSALVAVGLVIAAVYWLRVRRLEAEADARFDERLAERTRIAQDFHDTLLQTIQGSKMVADNALDKSADETRMRRALENLSVWLGQAMQEGRSALNSLRSSTTPGNDLADSLRRAGDECLAGRRIAFSVSVEGVGREMHPIVRDEVYRIGYEAIRNACIHSEGTRINIVLSYINDFRLSVHDNGRGMDPEMAAKGREGHYGLIGMYERASRIRGKLTISSAPNSGTELELVVPRYIMLKRSAPSGPRMLERTRKVFSRRS